MKSYEVTENGIVYIVEEHDNGTVVKFPKPLMQPQEEQTRRILTKYAFSQRFTFQERVAIKQATQSDPEVAVLESDLKLAGNIDLDDPAVAASLDLLVSKGLLTPERKTEILN